MNNKWYISARDKTDDLIEKYEEKSSDNDVFWDMLVKFQHTVFYDILSTYNIKKIVNNNITCYCCGE